MNKNGKKEFDRWNEIKQALHKTHRITGIVERQVWWAAVGENIGVEINGKGKYFGRPVLILKKLNEWSFLGVPLTSQKHAGTWYVNFCFQNKNSYAVLSQIRIFSVARLYNNNCEGKVSKADFKKVWDGFRRLYRPSI